LTHEHLIKFFIFSKKIQKKKKLKKGKKKEKKNLGQLQPPPWAPRFGGRNHPLGSIGGG
jgi:hypothetical protein